MKIIFLGTSAGTPTRDRNVTGVGLSFERDWFLFDCGEGTQHRLLNTSLSLNRLRRIFVSHLHGDHCFGLFGLLGSRALAGITAPLDLYGPVGLEEMVRTTVALSGGALNDPIRFHTVDEKGGRVLDEDSLQIEAVPAAHRGVCFSWWIREAPHPGELNPERARTLGIPFGPLLGRLKAGESITLDDGRIIEPNAVVAPSKPGRSLVIAGDNSDPDGLLAQTGTLDLLVHEATFTERVLEELGGDRGHSTAARVARAATAAGVEHLILTHFSPRFTQSTEGMGALRAEAREAYAGPLYFAEDFQLYHLDRDRRVRDTPTSDIGSRR